MEGAGVTPSWVFSNEGGGAWSSSAGAIRFDFENDQSCGGTNSNTQSGSASWTMNLAEATEITLSMDGKGEAEYEEMTMNSDGVEVARVQAAGDATCSVGTCDMCSVQMPPTTLSLAAGITCTDCYAYMGASAFFGKR